MLNLKVFVDGELATEHSFESGSKITLGRSGDCDLVLEDHPGVSRKHLTIEVKESSAEVQLVSTSGKLISNGENISSYEVSDGNIHIVSVPPYDFHLSLDLPNAEKEESVEKSITASQGNEKKSIQNHEDKQVAITGATSNQIEAQESSVDGFDTEEKTIVGQSQNLTHSIKVFKDNRFEQELLIEGNAWNFGRDPKSDIVIKSKGASRNHFTIFKTGTIFYVKDLGSSNGTQLNKQLLPGNQEIELKSGDYIEVGDYRFIFEIKDSKFEEKVKEIATVQSHYEVNELENIDEIRSNAMVLGDEILRIPGDQSNIFDDSEKAIKENKKKKFMMILIALIGLSTICYVILTGSAKDNINKSEKLALEKEKQVRKAKINAATDKFNLALRFYNESQFERCIIEIDEFMKFGIETEETAGATELRNQCDIEKERLQRQKDLEEQNKKEQELRNQVKQLIENCKESAQQGMDVLTPCLEPALALDPSNEGISELNDIAETADLEREQNAAKQKKYRILVSKGNALYKKATTYEKDGDWKKAKKAYEIFLKSKYPDPKKQKNKAQVSLDNLIKNVEETLNSARKDSDSHLAKSNYKLAILAAKKGLKINRDDEKLLKTKNEAEKLLTRILKKYYQESIIEEDYGDTKEAQLKWKKIREMGVEGSEYHKKALHKLKYYDEGS